MINEPKLWDTVIGKDEALKLIQTVSDLEEELHTRLSDEAYSRIVFSLGFSLYRIRNGREIEEDFYIPVWKNQTNIRSFKKGKGT